MNLLSAVTPGKKCSIFHWPVIFLQFDKCDVIFHLHTVTGRNLTGQFFNRPITVAEFENNTVTAELWFRLDRGRSLIIIAYCKSKLV